MSKVNQRNVQNRRYSECMPPVNEFFAALAFRGMFRREFGRKLGVSDTMISLVAHGLKRSRRIETAIRDFTRSAWVEMSRRYGDENRTLQSEIESLQKELDASRDDMRSQFIRLTAIIEGLHGDENRTLQSEIESLQKELDASRDDMRSQFIRLTAIIEGLQGKK